MPSEMIYTFGGTVQAGGGFYLSRHADDELLDLCRRSAFAYVLTARQMGKSSLMVRTVDRLANENIRSVIIDLTQIGAQVTPEQWYLGLLAVIEEQLALDTDAVGWWKANADIGFTQRMTRFFEAVLLKEVAEPVVIFVDEIDTTLSLGFTDDFYAAIRYLYNARATKPEFKRLSFALIGVATPGDLIRDPQRTPFNIGQRVDLDDFTYEEAAPLAEGLKLPPGEARQALRWAMKWTNGHPYLTQRLCMAMVEAGHLRWTESDVDRVVADRFFGAMSEQDNNLQFVRDMLTKRAPDVEGALTTYREIRSGKRPVRDEEQSIVKSHLKLSGVVRREDAGLRTRNRIYETVFDERWIKQHLRVDLVKRVKRVSVNLAPYAAAVLLILSIYGWLLVRTLSRDAKNAIADKQSAEESLKRATEETAKFTAMTQAAQKDYARQQELARKDREEAMRQLMIARREKMIAQRDSYEANANLQKAKDAAAKALDDIAKANVDLAKANDDTAKANEVKAQAVYELDKAVKALNHAQQELAHAQGRADEAKKQVDAAEAAKEALKLANKLQEEQDQKAKEEVYAKEIFRFHTGPVINVATHPQDSNLIVTASADGKAQVVDIRDKVSAKHTQESGSALVGAVFSSNDKSVVTASVDGKIRVYDADTGKEQTGLAGYIGDIPLKTVQQYKQGRPVLGNFGSFVAMEGREGGTLQVWDLKDSNKGPLVLRGRQGELKSLTVSPAGQFIVAVNKTNTLQVWDRTKPEKALLEFTGHTGPITSLAFSPDESLLVTASMDNTARTWSLTNPRKKPVIMNKHRGPLTSVAFSPDGKWVVTASKDGKARVWVANSGKEVAELRNRTFISVNYAGPRSFPLNLFFPISIDISNKGDLPEINSATFSPDGVYVVTASEDGSAQVWKAKAGKKIATLRGHILGVQSAIFTPDGKSVITAGADHTVRLWDLCREKDGLKSSILGNKCSSSP